jgi:phospholipid/cholesterol/gamma-HCH transport system substrate-binding protein
MEPEARYALVGAVVVVLVLGLGGATAWLLSSRPGSDDRAYEIVFERQSLEGLEVRSEVRMRGIRVGAVTGYVFSSERSGAVQVFVSVAASTPVRGSTRAIVDRHLVTGLATIRLLNLDETSPLLPEPGPGERAPVIPEGESELQQFAGTIAQLAERLDEVMKRVNAVLSAENQAAFAETLDGVRKLSANANQAVTRLGARYDRVGADASTGMRELTAAVQQLRADVARLSSRTDDLLASGGVELRFTASEIRAAADELGAAARKLAAPRSALLGPPDAGLGPGEERE